MKRWVGKLGIVQWPGKLAESQDYGFNPAIMEKDTGCIYKNQKILESQNI